MDNLRLILILVGVLILAAIVLLHRPRGQRKRNHARWLQKRSEPALGESDGGKDSDSESEQKVEPILQQTSFPSFGERQARRQPESPIDEVSTDPPSADAEKRTSQLRQPDKIVSLFVRRKEERRINGSELLDAAVKAGLSFGEMNIFHRIHEGDERPVFSMANLTPPGHFDASAWNVFDTPGVALFVTLPAPVSALDAWDAMLATGRRIAELLNAELLDDTKCLLTRQRIAQVRDEMRDYDREHGLKGSN
ncbi:MAG: cell division protein ZipA [Wenzhouxiangella sp.]|nr:cell division protein ZipA [Wenzhouxiangella sp.]